MFIKQPYKAKAMHILFVGTDVSEEKYTFKENEAEIGEMSVYIDKNSMYIDYFVVYEPFRGNGWGTKMLETIFMQFANIENVWAMAEEEILDSFWKKQKGYRFKGEGSDEQEGYYWFEIQR